MYSSFVDNHSLVLIGGISIGNCYYFCSSCPLNISSEALQNVAKKSSPFRVEMEGKASGSLYLIGINKARGTIACLSARIGRSNGPRADEGMHKPPCSHFNGKKDK